MEAMVMDQGLGVKVDLAMVMVMVMIMIMDMGTMDIVMGTTDMDMDTMDTVMGTTDTDMGTINMVMGTMGMDVVMATDISMVTCTAIVTREEGSVMGPPAVPAAVTLTR
ncbi:uncharacterized protein LOC115587874 isoform X1 [Lates japonicus]|uniref:Uncharacterized protein n=1 Tax=Lates japonicus TaxID=270547 RepID=A0AAD3MD47_LATJO|nr:uncharacterized protein AKAME5_000455700 [Lates japonicus]